MEDLCRNHVFSVRFEERRERNKSRLVFIGLGVKNELKDLFIVC